MNKILQKKKKYKIRYTRIFNIVKVLLICLVIFGLYYVFTPQTNTISLLAANEDNKGRALEGSVVKLKLEIKPGSGQTFVKLDTLNEIDTQVSIINSQKIGCEIFEVDCSVYDFYYEFDSTASLLKGPSASSAIAILVGKTIKNEKIDNSIVITGSLSSGGIIGNVGGIESKIKTAQQNGFDKIIIPVFSDFNQSLYVNNTDIEVIPLIDIIEAYNYFEGKNISLPSKNINDTNYQLLMQNLGDMMCMRTEEIKEIVNFTSIKQNSSLNKTLQVAQNSLNASIVAKQDNSFYSQGSFCYNANLNYRVVGEAQKNLTLEQREEKISELKREILDKEILIKSKNYTDKIETVNDFYVYLIINNRINDAKNFIDESFDIDTALNETNQTKYQIKYEKIKQQKEVLYSHALERYYTVLLWEKLIVHDGSKMNFKPNAIKEACVKINKELSINLELLQDYGINVLNEELKKQFAYSLAPRQNQYLCIYNGLELKGKINTIFNSIGITNNNQKEYIEKINEIAQERLIFNNENDFPLIPYIYNEYSSDLIEQGDYNAAMLYSNYAIAYADLNLYIERNVYKPESLNSILHNLFDLSISSLIFIGALLILIAFIGDEYKKNNRKK